MFSWRRYMVDMVMRLDRMRIEDEGFEAIMRQDVLRKLVLTE